MTSQYNIKRCFLEPTDASGLQEPFDLTGGNPTILYHESILSPSIALSVSVFDKDAGISREGISGGERIQVEVEYKGNDLEPFKITEQHKMVVNGVKDLVSSMKGQTATLEAVSEEVMVNETARISKRYSDNISTIVEQILIDDSKGITTSKTLDQEQSGNKYSFVGNYRKPFDLIQWLQPKAAKDIKKEFGFLFWETLDGYKFKSIDTIFKEKPEDKEGFSQIELPIDTNFKVMVSDGTPNSDIVMNLNRGMYANKTIYVDLISGEKTVEDFAIEDIETDKEPPKVPKGLEKKPTKLMFRILDQGALQEGPELKKVEKPQDLAKLQNKSYGRNNLLFSQAVRVVIPLNTKMRAGKTIMVKFPFNEEPSDEERKLGEDNDKDFSGQYVIAELKHEIGDGEANTQLTLIRNLSKPTA